MTYRELQKYISEKFTEKQLDMEVQFYNDNLEIKVVVSHVYYITKGDDPDNKNIQPYLVPFLEYPPLSKTGE